VGVGGSMSLVCGLLLHARDDTPRPAWYNMAWSVWADICIRLSNFGHWLSGLMMADYLVFLSPLCYIRNY
jgi:hypothetical protein